MCNCISILSRPGSYTHPRGRTITAVEVPTALRWDQQANTLSAVTVSVALLTIGGRKSKEKYTVSHTYCPFCGEKYGQPTDDVASFSGDTKQ